MSLSGWISYLKCIWFFHLLLSPDTFIHMLPVSTSPRQLISCPMVGVTVWICLPLCLGPSLRFLICDDDRSKSGPIHSSCLSSLTWMFLFFSRITGVSWFSKQAKALTHRADGPSVSSCCPDFCGASLSALFSWFSTSSLLWQKSLWVSALLTLLLWCGFVCRGL